MSFRKEPPFTHGAVPRSARTAIVLVNLGTPDAPTWFAVRRYLKQFLSDPRVVEIPRLLWWCILNLVILPFRSGKSARKYDSIWTNEGSPLKVNTQKQAALMRATLKERGHDGLKVVMAMRYGSPSLSEVLDKLKAEQCERVAILPAFPQYSGATTGSIFDAVFSHYSQVRNIPELRLIKNYHDNDLYIDALHDSVLAHWDAHGRGEQLVMSFHGMPQRTLELGDPYHCECHKTARLLAEKLRLARDEYVVTFQSRFGKAAWLQPYTEPTVLALAEAGVRRLDVICPGFTSDCLETLEEVAMEIRQAFMAAGGTEFNYIACLNDQPSWIAGLAEIAEQHVIGWPTMMTPAQRELHKKECDVGRLHAVERGASV